MTAPTPEPPAAAVTAMPFSVFVNDDDRTVFVSPEVKPGRYTLEPGPDGSWRLVPQPPPPRPYRVVDRFQHGWLTCNETPTTYPRVDADIRTFEQLAAERGPLRPVVAPRREQTDLIRQALAAAKTKAVASLLVALHRVAQECYDRDGHDHRLVAGRPGSWESDLLPWLAFEVGAGITDPRRVDERAVAAVADMLRCWVFPEDRYVEVAENLAGVFGRVVDGRGGWDQVTERWLRNSVYDERLRNYLTSKSYWFTPGP